MDVQFLLKAKTGMKTFKLPYNQDLIELFLTSHFQPDDLFDTELSQDTNTVLLKTGSADVARKLQAMFKTLS